MLHIMQVDVVHAWQGAADTVSCTTARCPARIFGQDQPESPAIHDRARHEIPSGAAARPWTTTLSWVILGRFFFLSPGSTYILAPRTYHNPPGISMRSLRGAPVLRLLRVVQQSCCSASSRMQSTYAWKVAPWTKLTGVCLPWGGEPWGGEGDGEREKLRRAQPLQISTLPCMGVLPSCVPPLARLGDGRVRRIRVWICRSGGQNIGHSVPSAIFLFPPSYSFSSHQDRSKTPNAVSSLHYDIQ